MAFLYVFVPPSPVYGWTGLPQALFFFLEINAPFSNISVFDKQMYHYGNYCLWILLANISLLTKGFFIPNLNKRVFLGNLDLCQSLGSYDWQLRGFTNMALCGPCVDPKRIANCNAELIIACCILPVAHGLPPSVYCLWHLAQYGLPVGYRLLFTALAYCRLPIACYLKPSGGCLLVIDSCTLPIAYCMLHTAHCIWHIAYCPILAIPIEPIPLPLPHNGPPRPASLAVYAPIQTNSHSVGALACYSVVEAIC